MTLNCLPRMFFLLWLACGRSGRVCCLGLLSWLAVAPVLAADWTVEAPDQSLEENIRLHLGPLSEYVHLEAADLQRKLSPVLRAASQSLGYYRLQWHWQRDGDALHILVDDPGPRVTLGSVKLVLVGEGQQEKVLNTIAATVARRENLVVGQPLDHGAYQRFKQRWLDEATTLGYLQAAYRVHRVSVDLDTQTASLELVLDTGPAFKVSAITYQGSDLDPKLLQELNPLKSGDRFYAPSLAEVYSRFSDSGYFRDVVVQPVDDGSGGRRLDILLEDAASQVITTGLGFSTDTGPRGRLGLLVPVVNRWGHQWQNEARVAEAEQTLTSEYRIPITNPLDHYFALNVGWKRKNVEDTDSRVLTTGATVHQLIGDGGHFTYGMDVEYESYQQGSEEAQSVLYGIPGVGWDYVRFEGPERMPDWGYRWWINFDGSIPGLGADEPFARGKTGIKWLFTAWDYNEVLFRAEAGVISQQDISMVPASRRFFTGGDQTVRGYAYESLAPEDAEGKLIGGRYLNVASIEYRWRYSDTWHFAAFADTGRAFQDMDAPFHSSAGVGAHWQSPIGPIRFDIAKPIADEQHQAVRLHVTMGPSL